MADANAVPSNTLVQPAGPTELNPNPKRGWRKTGGKNLGEPWILDRGALGPWLKNRRSAPAAIHMFTMFLNNMMHCLRQMTYGPRKGK